MNSERYGDIENMVVSLKMATPKGTIETLSVPRTAAGANINEIILGSEGTIGIITEAVVKVHKLPAIKEFIAFMFSSFGVGVDAIAKMVEREAKPSLVRLYDEEETQLMVAMKKSMPGHSFHDTTEDYIKKIASFYMKYVKGFERDKMSICIIGFTGNSKAVIDLHKSIVTNIFKEYKASPLGSSPAWSWYEKRYDLPLVRDFILSHGLWVDVVETATNFTTAIPLWKDVKSSITKSFDSEGQISWVGCHLSHTYHSGSCFYFHFAGALLDDQQKQQDQYLRGKQAAVDAILRSKGTLTHHHSIGYEHIPWMRKQLRTPQALALLRSIKNCLDPKNICNPGKLLPEPNEGGDDEREVKSEEAIKYLYNLLGREKVKLLKGKL